MVEGVNARTLFEIERRSHMAFPGLMLLALGVGMPALIEFVNNTTGRFTIGEINLFNGVFFVIMVIGWIFLAYGVTYSRNGHILLPLALCFLILLSFDLFVLVDFTIYNYVPGPAGLFILPFASPGEIPFLLTLFFILLIVIAHFSYTKDPRRSSMPKYLK